MVETKSFYDGVTTELDRSIFGDTAFFLNLGYAPTNRPQRAAVKLPRHVIDGNSVRLVLETIGASAVRFCGRRHRHANAWFTNADAQRLTSLDASFDIVTNIESSHSYPQVEAFYAEVNPVLRPRSDFLYADVFLSREKRFTSLDGRRSREQLSHDARFLKELPDDRAQAIVDDEASASDAGVSVTS